MLPPSSGFKIIRKLKSGGMRWTGHVSRMGKLRNAYKNLVGKPEGKRQLGRPKCRSEINVKMNLH
jgi:hypothetical protein